MTTKGKTTQRRNYQIFDDGVTTSIDKRYKCVPPFSRFFRFTFDGNLYSFVLRLRDDLSDHEYVMTAKGIILNIIVESLSYGRIPVSSAVSLS